MCRSLLARLPAGVCCLCLALLVVHSPSFQRSAESLGWLFFLSSPVAALAAKSKKKQDSPKEWLVRAEAKPGLQLSFL
jgi:hypothetical protein